jgi:hypothetical protein
VVAIPCIPLLFRTIIISKMAQNHMLILIFFLHQGIGAGTKIYALQIEVLAQLLVN